LTDPIEKIDTSGRQRLPLVSIFSFTLANRGYRPKMISRQRCPPLVAIISTTLASCGYRPIVFSCQRCLPLGMNIHQLLQAVVTDLWNLSANDACRSHRIHHRRLQTVVAGP
jgi:hypothetical protein